MSQGRLRVFQRTDSGWNPFLESTDPIIRKRINEQVSELGTFTPYFDQNLNGLPWMNPARAWVYLDAYAVYVEQDAQLITEHPDWILHDAQGNKLFIPWGGTPLTQYAGDIANPDFRAYMLQKIQTLIALGYNLWFDDVNLNMSVGDANKNPITPIDSVLGIPLTTTAWESYAVAYMQLVRSAVRPSARVLHNSVWSVPMNSLVQAQIASADLINLERGVGDTGIVGGTGQYSISALMNFIDTVQNSGAGVVLNELEQANLFYAVAFYYLISSGRDYIGFMDMLPDATWPTTLMSLNLGAAQTSRYRWGGTLWRRDFDFGFVLLNEPGAASITRALPSPMYDVYGNTQSSVTLGPRQGQVLLFRKI